MPRGSRGGIPPRMFRGIFFLARETLSLLPWKSLPETHKARVGLACPFEVCRTRAKGDQEHLARLG